MLLAALAWPSLALAQGQPQALPVDKPKVFERAGDASKLRQHESCTHDMKATKLEDINADTSSPDTTPGRSNAPRKQPQRESEYLYINENATGYNEYVPAYGNYYEQTTSGTTQVIYPASMLTEFVDKPIKAIRFYCADTDGLSFYGGQLTATLGTTNSASFGRNDGLATIKTGSVTATTVPKEGDKYLTFVFDTPFVYTSTSGNLIIQTKINTAGTYGQTYFVGQTYSGNTPYYSYNQRQGRQHFLPKTLFFIEDGNSISTEDIDFGKVTCGQTATQSVTITNKNKADAAISWSFGGTNGDKFTTTQTATTVAAGGSVTFPITFAPGQMTGPIYGRLDVEMGNTKFRVALNGQGVKNYDATVTPTSLDFGEVFVNDNGTAKVTLTNTGLQAIYPIAQTDNPAFTVSAAGSGNIAKDGTRTYTVYFNPTAEQAYTGTLNLHDDANGINLRVALKGTGVTTAAPFVVDLQQSGTTHEDHTVADGSSYNRFVPIYGNYLDYGCSAQMTYPAEVLHLNVGDKIYSIKFYASKTLNQSDATGSVEDNPIIVKVHETGNVTTPQTTVCTDGSIWSGSDEVTFTFNQPYEYKGGDLVIDMSCEAKQGAYYTGFTWYVKEGIGTSTYTYNRSVGANPTSSVTLDLLPSMTMDIVPAEAGHEHVRAEEVAWGSQNVDAGSSFYSKEVTIYNPNSTAVEANLTIADSDPFSFAQNTTSKSHTMTLPADENTTLTLYFNPTAAAGYTGHLNIATGSHNSSTRLTGVGLKAGEIATRDSSFFASLPEYEWTDADGKTHYSNYTEIATDPRQMIALLKNVYTNKQIPGNWKRGFDEQGRDEQGNEVFYHGVGTIERTSSDYRTKEGYEWQDTHGWGIEGDVVFSRTTIPVSDYQDTYAYTATMDSMQYKPDYEGVTLLLVEMKDDFNHNDLYADGGDYKTFSDSPYDNLIGRFERCIKSVRIITQSKRTGSKDDKSSGTLFKIDCDKMNKFFLIAKGQLRKIHNSWDILSDVYGTMYYAYDYCRGPLRVVIPNAGTAWVDEDTNLPFWHMFEQFSPVAQDAGAGMEDLYRLMTERMQSFGVQHDCHQVPMMDHQFMMYADDDQVADCQDVRDMMFFVPDYRMMKDDQRDLSLLLEYLNYNTEHQPKMGIYVIHQDEITGEKVANQELYKLNLTWKSNMDDFLPRDEQEYQLYQMVTDDFGDHIYVPVYERDSQGRYKTSSGEWVTDTVGKILVPVTLSAAALTSADARHNYPNVYIDQEEGGRTVTFAVRGQDADHFLSLQMSNEESYFIPGTDAAEILHLTSATYYSRFNPQEVRNCYSNKIEVKTNDNSVRRDYLNNGTTFNVLRMWNERVGETTQLRTATVATATVSGTKLNIHVADDTQSPASMFPKGENDGTDGRAIGYHANPGTNYQTDITYKTVSGVQYANFDFVMWDNFAVDVAANQHPGQYTYEVVFTAASNIDGTQPQTNQAHSNDYNVPVYKTDSRINEPITLADVLDDTKMSPEYEPGNVEFDAQVRQNSKSSLLRYDAYRWDEAATRYLYETAGGNDEEEDDVPPTGIAGNQGEYYTVTMNKVGTEDYYVGNPVSVSGSTANWATFVDYYPTNANTDAGAYTYAPVVELYTRGYASHSTETNKVRRHDYNTYGGPLKNTAVGKLEVKPYDPTIGDSGTNRALMSDYYWTKGEDKYSYYNILLTFKALDVPEGYELYKVRAWRRVDRSVLDEELDTRKSRIDNIDEDGWLLYEDINYGDPLTVDGATKMSCSSLKPELLGERSSQIARPQNPDATGEPEPLFGLNSKGEEDYTPGETRATFGAKRLDLPNDDNDFPTLHAEFKVRAYFTRNTNPLVTGTDTQNAPRRAESAQAMTGSDYDYYVAEGRTEVVEHGGSEVITGITGIKADTNREVVGVTYVNTLGQQSSRPFEGVNMVVTRYSDGTTTTTKVVK
ncbi:MAG: choice-of-anchor D domain-containing protein [Muribaculaceae bacterium]|nr:choice-of-anchor D domain-containing protein [Muribaculaceae bacterium]